MELSSKRAGLVGRTTIAVLALAAASFVGNQPSYAASQTVTIDASLKTGPVTHVGAGFLDGLSEDATLPGDTLVAPLRTTLWRGAGAHLHGLNGSPDYGWLGDGYKPGPGYQRRINYTIAVAKRATSSLKSKYVLLFNDIWGTDDGQPTTAKYPCDNGDCSNWVTFIDTVVGAMKSAGLTSSSIEWEPYNEPNGSGFWARPFEGTQYYQMWNTAYREIKRLVPNAKVVGPSTAGLPLSQLDNFLATTKAAGTLPDIINWHNIAATAIDPAGQVANVRAIEQKYNIPARPLEINEYTAHNPGNTAWYLSRLQSAGISEAVRGVFGPCCVTPNLGGVLTNGQKSPEWWTYRAYADLSGQQLATTGSGSLAGTASLDQNTLRLTALLGTLAAVTNAPRVAVAIKGLNSAPWLQTNGRVRITVKRMPSVTADDNTTLNAPIVVSDNVYTLVNGTVTVPLTWSGQWDSYALSVQPA